MAAMGKKFVVVWEWMNEFGRWRPYDPRVADFIESNHQLPNNQIGLGSIDNSLNSYAIDFQTMCQIRYGTGTARPVRRSLYPSDSPPGKGVVWQWEGDIAGQWHTYDMDVACLMEDHFSKNPQSPGVLDLSKSAIKLPYILDFSIMVQQRIQTGKKRTIRREILPQPYPTQNQGTNSNATTLNLKRGIVNSTQSTSNTSGDSGGKMPRLSSNAHQNPQFITMQNQPYFTVSSAQSSVSSANTGHLISSTASLSNTNATLSNMIPGNSSAFTNVSGASSGPVTRRQLNMITGNISQQSSPVIPLHQNSVPNLAFPNQLPISLANINTGVPNFGATNAYPPNLVMQSNSQGPQMAPQFIRQMGSFGQATSIGMPPGVINIHGIPGPPVNGFVPNSTATGSLHAGNIPVPGNLFSKSGRGASRISPVVTSATNILMSPAVPLLLSPQSPPGASSSNSKHLDLPQEARIPNNVPKNTKKHQSSGITAEDVFQKYVTPVSSPPDEEDCCICCERLSQPSGYGDHGKPEDKVVYQLSKCNHMFHKLCVFAMYNSGSKNGSVQCPTCKTIYGEKHGNCPKGVMEYHKLDQSLPGHLDCHTIRILYHISPGIQGSEHPHPGKRFTCRAFPRVCYLPDNDDGRKILKLLIVAWKRRLTFTIGVSSTTGETDTVTWNEIHHKTEFGTNYSGHGYPDPNYFENVLAELSVQGVTDSDL